MFRAISVTVITFSGDEITSEKRESILVHNILKVSPVVGRGPTIPTYIAFTARNEQRGVYVAESVREVERQINTLDRKVLIALTRINLVGDHPEAVSKSLILINPGHIVWVNEWAQNPAYMHVRMECGDEIFVKESLREIYNLANGEVV